MNSTRYRNLLESRDEAPIWVMPKIVGVWMINMEGRCRDRRATYYDT